MKTTQFIRWGIPVLAFCIYVKWGGFSMALVLAGILFALASGLIHWHRTEPGDFFKFMRAVVVIFVLLPAIGLTLLGATSGVFGLLLAAPVLAFALLLTRWTYRNAKRAPVGGLPSMASQNLFAANALTDATRENTRRAGTRGALLHARSENLELARQNAELKSQLSRTKAVSTMTLEEETEHLFGKDDPFADPNTPRSS